MKDNNKEIKFDELMCSLKEAIGEYYYKNLLEAIESEEIENDNCC